MAQVSHELARRIEEASLNSWPALQQVLFDGWILRFSEGYTKRANSVNPLYTSTLDVKAKVEACQRLYSDRGLRTVFRITPFVSPADLDQVLEARGYEKVDPTLVLYLDLQCAENLLPSTLLRDGSLDDWLALFCRFHASPLEAHRTHRQILEAIPGRRHLAILEDAGCGVACGVGVVEGDCAGFFDIVTDPPQRRKGYGARLVGGLLDWARGQEARHAYIQVVEANVPARRLYGRFGFREAYRYWYRVLDLT